MATKLPAWWKTYPEKYWTLEERKEARRDGWRPRHDATSLPPLDLPPPTGPLLNLPRGFGRLASTLNLDPRCGFCSHVDEAAWLFITMERSAEVQLLAEAAGTPVLIDPEMARLTRQQVGSHFAGWFSFQPLYDKIVADQPDLLE